jgi:lipopolysaccharide transport system permease protein
MAKVIYTSEPEGFSWRQILPWLILRDILRHRTLIATTTLQNLKATYQASYLGLAWQILLPVIMLSIFYLIFGRIFGGKFIQNGSETPLDYALALFVGLGFFNFVAQNIGAATSLMPSNSAYVKTLSFPLETLSVISVLNALINLLIGLGLSLLVFLFAKGYLHPSAICVPFYVLCVFLIALGISWGLSALAVFVHDVTAVTSPLTLILMFMCPIFYPASMVPKSIRWVIDANPLAVIIEDVRACMLYGVWPSAVSVAAIFAVSVVMAVIGYFFFIRAKSAFADVM